MKLTDEEKRGLPWGDTEGWDRVKGTEEIVDQRRWSTVRECVVHHLESGGFYRMWWETGSTESQDGMDDKFGDPYEVELKEVTKLEWVVKQ